MKKQKSIIIILSVICIALLIGNLAAAVSYNKVLKSSKRPSDETIAYHKTLTEKIDSFTVLGVKYIKTDDSYNLPENIENGQYLGGITDFVPSFKKYTYSVDGTVQYSLYDKNILIAWFTNGEKYYFIPENLKEEYK